MVHKEQDQFWCCKLEGNIFYENYIVISNCIQRMFPSHLVPFSYQASKRNSMTLNTLIIEFLQHPIEIALCNILETCAKVNINIRIYRGIV